MRFNILDAYQVLGLSENADENELKRAFRKEAMKWHPDRAGDSGEAREKFHQASQAYQLLSQRIRRRNGSEQAKAESSSTDDDLIREVLLAYALDLIRTGLDRQAVNNKIQQQGCSAELADKITVQAFARGEDVHSKADKPGHGYASGAKTRFDFPTIEAILGRENPSPKQRVIINDYHKNFNNLSVRGCTGSILLTSRNRYLSKVFNRSIVLFLIIALFLYYFPQVTRYLPLTLVDYFQIPNITLSLIIIWSFYRKLWLLCLSGLSVFSAMQIFYYSVMPYALDAEYNKVLIVSIISYLPFLLIANISNLFYYRKVNETMESIERDYVDVDGKQIILKNEVSPSKITAALGSLLVAMYFFHMIPQTGSLAEKVSLLLDIGSKTESYAMRQNKALISEAKRQFDIAEQHLKRNPPDYKKSLSAYIASARRGSLLSCYQVGYMYLTGLGIRQDDQLAFEYFTRAVEAPIASQPHNLDQASYWLAESYNALGLMYLGGYGTHKSRVDARAMFFQALKYQPGNTLIKKLNGHSFSDEYLRQLIKVPDFNIPE